jgi:hypothetical protein
MKQVKAVQQVPQQE